MLLIWELQFPFVIKTGVAVAGAVTVTVIAGVVTEVIVPETVRLESLVGEATAFMVTRGAGSGPLTGQTEATLPVALARPLMLPSSIWIVHALAGMAASVVEVQNNPPMETLTNEFPAGRAGLDWL
jgi:fructose-specific phosphotransferase system IIC component